MIKALLCDADGCLFDATELHRITLNQALKIYGYEISLEDHKKTFNGLPTKTKLNILTETRGLPRGLHSLIEAEKQRLTMVEIPKRIKPNEELNCLLSEINKKILLAVCSNAKLDSIKLMAEYAKLPPFDLILGNESILHPKPSPDIYLLAAKQLGIPISECAILEDSSKGITSAIQAGPGQLIVTPGPSSTTVILREALCSM